MKASALELQYTWNLTWVRNATNVQWLSQVQSNVRTIRFAFFPVLIINIKPAVKPISSGYHHMPLLTTVQRLTINPRTAGTKVIL